MLVTSLSPVSQKREFRFDGSMMALINDDMGFVRESVDAGARKLLAGLRYFRTSCGQVRPGHTSSTHNPPPLPWEVQHS